MCIGVGLLFREIDWISFSLCTQSELQNGRLKLQWTKEISGFSDFSLLISFSLLVDIPLFSCETRLSSWKGEGETYFLSCFVTSVRLFSFHLQLHLKWLNGACMIVLVPWFPPVPKKPTYQKPQPYEGLHFIHFYWPLATTKATHPKDVTHQNQRSRKCILVLRIWIALFHLQSNQNRGY